MKKLIERETHECEGCHVQQDYMDRCLRCGKDLCRKCFETVGKIYHHAVNFRGSDDGHYCLECDNHLTALNSDPLHKAYRKIDGLRMEFKIFYEGFEKRRELAEAHLRARQK